VVDRVGAGDAFLSITALAAVLHTPPELLCFVGNVVGALAVEILGNQKASDKDSVKKFAAMLLG
jgi:sugar/nucleoside kinase (ribokinase family)